MMMRKQKAMSSENRIRHCLGSCSGMTLTEMLAAVLILSMTAVAVAGGVVAVRDAFRKTTEKAEAQLVLATTAELMTDILSGAVDVRDGGTDGPEFLDGETGSWLRLQAVPYRDGQENRSGICRGAVQSVSRSICRVSSAVQVSSSRSNGSSCFAHVIGDTNSSAPTSCSISENR